MSRRLLFILAAACMDQEAFGRIMRLSSVLVGRIKGGSVAAVNWCPA